MTAFISSTEFADPAFPAVSEVSEFGRTNEGNIVIRCQLDHITKSLTSLEFFAFLRNGLTFKELSSRTSNQPEFLMAFSPEQVIISEEKIPLVELKGSPVDKIVMCSTLTEAQRWKLRE